MLGDRPIIRLYDVTQTSIRQSNRTNGGAISVCPARKVSSVFTHLQSFSGLLGSHKSLPKMRYRSFRSLQWVAKKFDGGYGATMEVIEAGGELPKK